MPLGWVVDPVTGENAVSGGGWGGDVPVNDNGFDHGDEDGDDAMDAVPASVAAAPVPAPTNDTPANNNGGAAAGASDDIDVVRRFLREVGVVPGTIVYGGSWA